MSGTTTPAVISGPAAVDSDGRAYTSSSAGGNGNAANLGNNTNVNLIPKKTLILSCRHADAGHRVDDHDRREQLAGADRADGRRDAGTGSGHR